MPRYIAFLRAANVGRRVLPMAALRARLTEAGLDGVETYIQSGNVRFSTPLRSRSTVGQHVEQALAAGFGFDVPTIVLTPAELRGVHGDALGLPPPLPGEPRRYVTFLKHAPAGAGAAALDGWDVDGERVRVLGRAVHWWLSKPTTEARLSNARIEQALGVGTTRGLTVVSSLAGRWGR